MLGVQRFLIIVSVLLQNSINYEVGGERYSSRTYLLNYILVARMSLGSSDGTM